MVVARTSLAFTCAVSRASSSSRMPISCASRRDSTSICARSWLGFFGGQAGDRLELAPLLLERGAEPSFLLDDRPLAADQLAILGAELAHPPLELVELARELFFLRQHALLDLLDTALALAHLCLD